MSTLLSQIAQGENQITEFKTSFQKEVIASVVAFANAKGGKVFIGVSDSGEIVGVNIEKETMQDWINQIKLNTSPSVIPDMYIESINEKTVVIVDVKEYPIKPISYKNRYLLRRANSNHVMSMEEIANEYLKTKNSSWDYYVDSTQKFNDISLEKVDKFIKRIEKNFHKSFDDNPMQVLQKYGLVRDEQITFGAYLLFVKDFCLISGVQVGRFKTPTDIIDTLSLNCDILTEIDELIIFIRKHLMVEYIITGNPQREERYDYPLDAIREIVLNMIVHRDYRDSSDSVIKIFDDRIEFFNPGDLYDDLTIEQLNSNNYKSKTRNKLIALMFKECGLIEKYGSVIERVKKLCKEHGIVEPKLQEIQKGFQVTLYKEKLNEGINKGINEGINEGINSLYLFIQNNPSLRVSQIAQKLNIPAKTLERWIKQLKDEEKLEYRGSKKTGGYFVK
ncbi:MAG: putative DNA binding domain-containing protein [Epsilonproteobacteria bacterium]|nr:putative DNA binding domain-containing protein [Campylobacterota bacterium]